MTWLPMPYSKESAGRNAMPSISLGAPASWEAGGGARRAQAPELPLSGFIIRSRCFSGVGGWGGREATNVSEPRLPHAQPGSRAEFLASPALRHAVLSYISAFPFLSLLFKMLRFSSLKIVFASNSITF